MTFAAARPFTSRAQREKYQILILDIGPGDTPEPVITIGFSADFYLIHALRRSGIVSDLSVAWATPYRPILPESVSELADYKIFLNAAPGTNLTVLLALILIFAPVFGLTPMRAFRVAILKVPNPIS